MSKLALILASGVAPAVISGAYANTLTGLIPSLYAGLDVVSRELVGYIPSVTRNATAERAAVGQTTTYPIAPPVAGRDITPTMVMTNPPDYSIDNGNITITKSREFPFGFNGEEQRGLNANGAGFSVVQADLFAQALRGIVNEMELDIATAAAAAASRAYGTAGTAPFASGVGDAAQIRKILDDNGAPLTGRSLIVNTSSGAALRTNTQLTKALEAGTTMTLRDGELLNLHGMSIKETGQAISKTKGTGAGATTTNAGFAVGATNIALASAGTGTITAGDVITFAGDTNKYMVVTGDADVSGGGSIVIAAPGLRRAIPAATTAITVGDSYSVGGVAFSSDAIVLAARAPALPQEGDLAIDRMMLTDPRSGMVFEVSVYPGRRMVEYSVAAAWGWKVVKPAHTALLLG